MNKNRVCSRKKGKRMRKYIILISIIFTSLYSQTDHQLIVNALNNYIQGTSYNQTDQIKSAFYSDAPLYLNDKDKNNMVVDVATYASWFEKRPQGEHNGRFGKILSIETYDNIAFAKAEIRIPARNSVFLDMFLLKKVDSEWKIISKTAASKPIKNPRKKILFIVSDVSFYGDTKLPTGNSFSEIVNAFDTFTSANYEVDFVSPNGGAIPLAYINTSDPLQKKYVYNSAFMNRLYHVLKPDQINPIDYAAVHYIGGGSAMFEVPFDKDIQKLAMSIYENYNGIISSVCHGTAGIIFLKDQNGKYLVDGKRINGYPDEFENKSRAYYETFSFNITQSIEKHGGTFINSPRGQAHVEVDGNVVTGQNYQSSRPVALQIIKMIESKSIQ
jgi:putative intracellular protease/amidase